MSIPNAVNEEARRIVLESKELRHEINTALLALHNAVEMYASEDRSSRDSARELLRLGIDKLQDLVRL